MPSLYYSSYQAFLVSGSNPTSTYYRVMVAVNGSHNNIISQSHLTFECVIMNLNSTMSWWALLSLFALPYTMTTGIHVLVSHSASPSTPSFSLADTVLLLVDQTQYILFRGLHSLAAENYQNLKVPATFASTFVHDIVVKQLQFFL